MIPGSGKASFTVAFGRLWASTGLFWSSVKPLPGIVRNSASSLVLYFDFFFLDGFRIGRIRFFVIFFNFFFNFFHLIFTSLVIPRSGR